MEEKMVMQELHSIDNAPWEFMDGPDLNASLSTKHLRALAGSVSICVNPAQ